MSPMVATRTRLRHAPPVETPSSAAMSVIGTTRSSGRSSVGRRDDVGQHAGMRLASLDAARLLDVRDGAVASCAEAPAGSLLAVVVQEPEADVGHRVELGAADLDPDLGLGTLALRLLAPG